MRSKAIFHFLQSDVFRASWLIEDSGNAINFNAMHFCLLESDSRILPIKPRILLIELDVFSLKHRGCYKFLWKSFFQLYLRPLFRRHESEQCPLSAPVQLTS